MQRILHDATGLSYVCATYERFSQVSSVLVCVYVCIYVQAIKALAPRLRAARTLRGPPRLVAASVTAMSEDLLLTPPLRIPQVAVGMILPQFVPVTA